jgi:hypothetical protein
MAFGLVPATTGEGRGHLELGGTSCGSIAERSCFTVALTTAAFTLDLRDRSNPSLALQESAGRSRTVEFRSLRTAGIPQIDRPGVWSIHLLTARELRRRMTFALPSWEQKKRGHKDDPSIAEPGRWANPNFVPDPAGDPRHPLPRLAGIAHARQLRRVTGSPRLAGPRAKVVAGAGEVAGC